MAFLLTGVIIQHTIPGMKSFELYVFDLDFTLWDCSGTWCDHTYPPYRKQNGHVRDSRGRKITLYPEVPKILNQLKTMNKILGLASRTGAPDYARQLINLFNIQKFFDWEEIYPGSKLKHFQNLRDKTGVPYYSMAFFDDEERNIREIRSLGVHCVYVPNGLTVSHIPEANFKTLGF